MESKTFELKDAKRVETKRCKRGKTYKVYTFECVSCGVDVNMQSYRAKKGTGLCIRCGQKGRPYEHILNELIYSCKKRGKREVSISYEEFLDLIKEARCHYCNKGLTFYPHTRDSEGNYVSRAYQLDRKDNLLDYTTDNCVTCCWECNRLKSDVYTYSEFQRIAVVLRQIQLEKELLHIKNKN